MDEWKLEISVSLKEIGKPEREIGRRNVGIGRSKKEIGRFFFPATEGKALLATCRLELMKRTKQKSLRSARRTRKQKAARRPYRA